MAVMSCALGWCVCDLTCFQMMWLVVRWFVVLPQRTTPVLLCTLYYKVLPQYYNVLLCTAKYYNVLLQYYSCTTKYYSSTTLYYKVLQRTTPVLLCTAKYYASTTQYYKVLVLQGTTPVLLCTTQYYSSTTLYYASTTTYYSVLPSTTKYYSSTTLYYNVLLQYYSVLQSTTPVLLVLQSTTPVLLCTTKYYSGTTLYYTVLRQYYSVLPSTTTYYSVLQSTTTYYSSTTLYYKVLLQYHSVLQSTTPVLLQYYKVLRQYYSVLQSTTTYYSSTTLYYKVLRQYYSSTTKYYSSTTLYYKVLLQYYSVLQSSTPVLLCTTKYYASTTLYYKVLLQYYSVLQSSTLYLCPPLLCTARRNKSHRPTTPNTAPATQNECHQWSASHMKAHFQCVEQVKSPSNLIKYCPCHAKWMSAMICVTYESSFPMRGASQVTLQPHQILHLPHKIHVISDLRHIWNVISNARSQSSHPPTSPNTAPATKSWRSRFARKIGEVLPPIERRFDHNPRIIRGYPTISEDIRRYPRIKSSSRTRRFGDLTRPSLETILYCKIQHVASPLSPKMSRSAAPVTKSHAPATQNQCHQWSASHMKRHFQCAEPVKSPSNLTKYCACHEILKVKICAENRWSASANRKTIRP